MWLIVETTGAKVEGYWVEVTGRGFERWFGGRLKYSGSVGVEVIADIFDKFRPFST